MGVVLGVLVVAVLAADRFLERDEVLRRMYQVGLAIALASFVIALGSAVFPISVGQGLDLSLSDADSLDAVHRVRDRQTFVTAGGLGLLVLGHSTSRRYRTLHLPAVVSGILLIAPPLLGNAASASAIFVLYEAALTGDAARNWLYAGVLAFGVLGLVVWGYREYEKLVEAVDRDGLEGDSIED